MKMKAVKIQLSGGLEARPVAMLVQVAASMTALFIWNQKVKR